MVGFSKKSKSSKRRGDREQGRGKKKGRGAGLRGGRGNAGKNKHKRVHYNLLGENFGRPKGFLIPPESQKNKSHVGVNVSELETVLPRLVEMGEASESAGVYTVDLGQLGVDKLLGSGQVRIKVNVTVPSATDQARAKVEEAGGSVTIAEAAAQ